jgi:membrane-associated protein
VGPLGDLFHLLTDPRALLAAFGALTYVGLFAVVFAETGLFAGFFFPGDSLLFVAGLLAAPSQANQAGQLSLPLVIGICVAAAILGNLTGFLFGRNVGRRLYARPESRFFKPEHLVGAQRFYEKHGGKTIILARFMPFVGTFAPIVAGAGNMSSVPFVVYSVIGGTIWGVGVPVAGYLLGERIQNIDAYLLPIIVLIVAISLLPAIIGIVRANQDSIRGRLGMRPRAGRVATPASAVVAEPALTDKPPEA